MSNTTPPNPPMMFVQLLFELDNFQLYTMQTAEDVYHNKPVNGYYWRNKDYPTGVGPLPTVLDVLNDWKAAYTNRPRLVALKPQNVLNVDFLKKKRTDPTK